MDSLPEELRQVLALSVEMKSREIAAAMGIAEGTVRTRLMRARGMLREKLAAREERRYAQR
jgi:RNA polymerase sigma-70 factor (ECF subfamily)